jgi:acyl-CoA reductase-like NAD-dependent aldehyde dehydrogenase
MRSRPDGLIQGIAERGFLIGGDRVARGSGGTYAHHDPATGEIQAEVALASAADVDDAVSAASAAGPLWAETTVDQRAKILFRLADLIEEHAEEASIIGALENGSPVTVAQSGPYTASWVRYYAGWADKIEGSVIPTYSNTGLDYVRNEPYGVIGALVPWNGPMMGMGQKVAPALAAGNTVVVKPPEISPFGAYRFAELALEAGLPPGVLNVLAGGAEAGEALVRHPKVNKVSFTGGRATARKVIEASAATITPLTLELGGKSANIIFPDADLDLFVPHSAFIGALLLSGQGCALPTRIYAHRDIYDQVIDRLVATVEATPVGDPLDPEIMMGPVVTSVAQDRILGVIDRAVAAGSGELLTGGTKLDGDLANGYFVSPTIFGNVDHASELARDEIFGPVLSVIPFSDEDEAIALANDSDFGLGAFVYTADLSRANRVATKVQAGFVIANTELSMGPTSPFGGYKQSGYGREGGRQGLDEFLQTKNIYLGL